jgi:hypothetical protein
MPKHSNDIEKGGKNSSNKHKNKKLNVELDLSPENIEKFRQRYISDVNKGFHIRIKSILMKPRSQWTPQETAFINKKLLPLLEEVKDLGED